MTKKTNGKNEITVDVECYINYFLVKFKNHRKGSTIEFLKYNDDESGFDREKLLNIMRKNKTIGFNSISYDLTMVAAALSGKSNKELKKISDQIITSGKAHWQVQRANNLVIPKNWEHIDIKEPSVGVMVSLKLYGGRMHSKRLQDLPIEPDARIKDEDVPLLSNYCENDLDTTWELYQAQQGQFALREKISEQIGKDVMSRSDAQIAEDIFRTKLEAEGVDVCKPFHIDSDYTFKYKMPDWITFQTEPLQWVKSLVAGTDFGLSAKMAVVLPKELSKAIAFADAKYKFGIGGLHSQESKQLVQVGDDDFLMDIDVASMYPSIILGQGLYPRHLTKKFLKIYAEIVAERLHAKKTGDTVTNNSLKIVINGSYGKFGSQYSFLFSPDLMIQTTITGQLSLLMLIERMTLAGFKVWSANTDGIVVQGKKSDLDKCREVIFNWELDTNLELEETHYKALYSRDVNNYLAVKTDNSYKGKGIFTKAGLAKNPFIPISHTAVMEYLVKGVPVEATIRNCQEITEFLTARTVNGGAIWKGEYLGKVVRWYYGENGDVIVYKKNGNKVPKSDGAVPLMDLVEMSELENQVDYDRYIFEAITILESMGVKYA